MRALAASRAMVQALRERLGAQCIETHISWVLLAGDDVYKLKKPVTLDVLDFSTPALRRAACEEEWRINRRTAPELYLGVVPISGTAAAPVIGGSGPVLDHAVHMRRFAQSAVLADRVARGALTGAEVDALAQHIAAFQQAAEVAAADSPYGRADDLQQRVHENFAPLQALRADDAMARQLADLQRWSAAEGERLRPLMQARRTSGFVREGHGDLHLGNLLWIDGAPRLFDAIEFNPQLRWIDVLADVAFAFMDLHAHGRAELAWRLLIGWLDVTGDHAGLALLPYSAVYRALVRAKVAALRTQTPGDAPAQEAARYVRLAHALALPRERVLWLASGVSGSGKSSQSQPLIESRGVVRLRADVERKRLFGLAPEQSSAAVPGGIYTPEASARTYAALRERARTVLQAGFAVLVDATLLRQAHRAEFIALAAECGVPCRLLMFDAPPEVLRERVRRRAAEGRDASEATVAVLERQWAEREPLTPSERAIALAVDTTQAVDWGRLLAGIDAARGPGQGASRA